MADNDFLTGFLSGFVETGSQSFERQQERKRREKYLAEQQRRGDLSTLLQLQGIQGLEEQRRFQREKGEEELGFKRRAEERTVEAGKTGAELDALVKTERQLKIRAEREKIKTSQELEARRQRFQRRIETEGDWSEELATEAEVLDYNPRNIWPEKYRKAEGPSQWDIYKARGGYLQKQRENLQADYKRFYDRNYETILKIAQGKKLKDSEKKIVEELNDYERRFGEIGEALKQIPDQLTDFLSGKGGGSQPGGGAGEVPQEFIDDQQELQRMLKAGETDQAGYERMLDKLKLRYGLQ